MIISLQPKKKLSLKDYLPNFDYDHDDDRSNNNDNEVSLPIGDTYENDNQESLSEKLYQEFDGKTTRIYPLNFFLFPIIFHFQVDLQSPQMIQKRRMLITLN
jgi:hypothetical protein